MTQEDLEAALMEHQPKTGIRDLHQHCTCGWTSAVLRHDFVRHQAAELFALLNTNTKEGPAAWLGEEPETPQLTTPPRSPSLNTMPLTTGSSTRSTASSTAALPSRQRTSPIT
ncbi:hypothetical protein HOU96_gp50 [Arthrobacter phage Maja]|uniref:Uncharacterized protein n=1 Tax=Arthrobacter phage Maja TaxID=2499009 RepID=A0A3S9UN39_9CAUD|nr:hypothetical protein HOU96_gp50 [Arthrobacter phage Maja]AZS11754.1 hypothetical protein PBI_MAJA_50 [Arthrobacter phage Maja]